MKAAFDLYALAMQHHAAGNLQQAEQLLRQFLQTYPQHADSHHMLGIIAYQTGQHAQAVQSIGEALRLAPWAANFQCNLGLVHEALGQDDEAVCCFQQALLLQPDLAEAHANLGNVRLRQENKQSAAAHYREALRLRPNFAEAYFGLGSALTGLAPPDEAAACFHAALRHRPHFPEACNNLGNVLLGQGKRQEAAACYQHALQLRQDFPEAHNNLGNVLIKENLVQQAIVHFQQALRLRPTYVEARDNLADAFNNLGNALTLQDRLEEAKLSFQQAIDVKPRFTEAWYNLGNTFERLADFDEAVRCYRQAQQMDPSFALAQWNCAMVRLLCGDFEGGWSAYEWRWALPGVVRREFSQPRWDGSDLQGRTILLFAEQGLGDTLHFVRYAPLVKQRGGQVIVECQPALMGLLASVPGIDRLVAHGTALPPFDVQAPLLSLPAIFRTDLRNMPAPVPYLQADPMLVEKWRDKIGAGSFKVGIAWQGTPTFPRDRQRSIALAHFGRLAKVEGVRLISLQKGPGADQLQALKGQFPILDLGEGLDEAAGPFMDTAAVMMNLDLVISSDTVIPHLAGALGIPVWVALPLVPDWRWLLKREDSPWYPTLRLFRQTRANQWQDVFDRMATELGCWVARSEVLRRA